MFVGCYAVAWPTLPFGIRLCSAWSLKCRITPAGRYLQRTGENAEFKSALFEAANHFYAADMARSRLTLAGALTFIFLRRAERFVCTVYRGARSGAHNFLYARAATWIDERCSRRPERHCPKAEAADGSVAALLLDP